MAETRKDRSRGVPLFLDSLPNTMNKPPFRMGIPIATLLNVEFLPFGLYRSCSYCKKFNDHVQSRAALMLGEVPPAVLFYQPWPYFWSAEMGPYIVRISSTRMLNLKRFAKNVHIPSSLTRMYRTHELGYLPRIVQYHHCALVILCNMRQLNLQV